MTRQGAQMCYCAKMHPCSGEILFKRYHWNYPHEENTGIFLIGKLPSAKGHALKKQTLGENRDKRFCEETPQVSFLDFYVARLLDTPSVAKGNKGMNSPSASMTDRQYKILLLTH